MNIISFADSACERVRRYLDSYINSELLVETNHEVLRHLETCSICSAEFASRSRLEAAVESQSVPAELPAKSRKRLRQDESKVLFAAEWPKWAAVSAAVLLVSVGERG